MTTDWTTMDSSHSLHEPADRNTAPARPRATSWPLRRWVQGPLLLALGALAGCGGIQAGDGAPLPAGEEELRGAASSPGDEVDPLGNVDPEAVGLSAGGLAKLANYVGGHGVVYRDTGFVHQWGDASVRRDIGSAAKPIYSYFLFRSIYARGKPAGVDERVSLYEPRLCQINPPGYKDCKITWRHLANQTSCYGVSEAPGTAFNYNDFQTALFFDTLFLKVWGASYSTVDSILRGPHLCQTLRCQDSPTFLAFGLNDRPGRVAISPRDFARFGVLFLNRGTFGGTRLLPADWVDTIVGSPLSNSIPQSRGVEAEMIPGQRSIGSTKKPDNQGDHLGSYSWMWWTNGVDRSGKRHWPTAPLDTYAAVGHNGKHILVVIPSRRLVASWNSSKIVGAAMQNEAFRLLVQSVL